MHKTAFIVPTSLRADVSGFVKTLKGQIESKNPGLNYEIVVVRQADEGPLNEGWLNNVGYQVSDAAYYVFHPTDHLPVDDADYAPENAFVQMAHVHLMTAEIFEEVNGYSNGYPGTCIHVHDMYDRVHKKRVLMYRREASFAETFHETEEHLKALKRLSSGYDRSKDGLSSLVYQIVSSKTDENGREVVVSHAAEVTTSVPPTTTTTTPAPATAEESDPADFHTFWRTRGEEDAENEREL